MRESETFNKTNSNNNVLSFAKGQMIHDIPLTYQFRNYHGPYFAELRSHWKISPDEYKESLSPFTFLEQIRGNALGNYSEGKSGSFMWYSPDGKYIIKTLTTPEMKVLKTIVHSYYNHMKKYKFSFLIKLVGLHSVVIQNDVELFFVVMVNIFDKSQHIDPQEKFDIKGSWVNRFSEKHAAEPRVYLGLDTNLMNEKKFLYITENQKKKLKTQLELDSLFLNGHGIIDYSLLLGIQEVDSTKPHDTELPPHGFMSHDNKEIYYVGLIDILQQYTLTKQLERFVKVWLHNKDKQGITIQPATTYRTRWLEMIDHICITKQI